MPISVGWSRASLSLIAALALGYWFGNQRTANAAADTFEFQLAGVDKTSSLLVYQPSNRTVFVYQGATTGNSNLQCSFKFVLGSPGGAIQRVNCDAASLR